MRGNRPHDEAECGSPQDRFVFIHHLNRWSEWWSLMTSNGARLRIFPVSSRGSQTVDLVMNFCTHTRWTRYSSLIQKRVPIQFRISKLFERGQIRGPGASARLVSGCQQDGSREAEENLLILSKEIISVSAKLEEDRRGGLLCERGEENQ